MCIRYELKKITGDIGLWIVIVMCLIINGFVIIRICADKLPNYLSLYANNESDYDDIINNAYENMESGSDIVYMQEIINSFEAREWNFEAYDSREKKVAEYTKKLLKSMKEIPDCPGIEVGYSMILDEVKTEDDAINEAITMMTKNKEKKRAKE